LVDVNLEDFLIFTQKLVSVLLYFILELNGS